MSRPSPCQRRVALLILLGIAALNCLALETAMTAHAAEWRSLAQPVEPPRPTAIIWSAGEARWVPPATRRAIDFAAEDQIEWLAAPLARTQDGTLVLAGTDATAVGPIASQTLAQFRQRDVGAELAPRFQGAKALTLDEALAAARDRVNLLLICHSSDDAQAAAQQVLTAGAQAQALLELAWCGTLAEHNRARAEWPAPLESVGTFLRLAQPTAPETAETAGPGSPAAIGLPLGPLTETPATGWGELIAAWRAQGYGVVLCEADSAGPLSPELRRSVLATRPEAMLTPRPGAWLASAAALASPGRRVQIAAHRGANRYAPENTSAAIDLAAELLMNWIEIDIQQASDGSFYLLHDRRLDRTTNRQGPLSELPADQLGELDAGSWFGGQRAALPRLDEVLDRFAHDPALAGVNLYLDAKNIPPEKLAELVGRYGLEERSVVYQAPGYLQRVREANPRIGLMPPLFQPQAVEAMVQKLKPQAFDTSWEILSAELIEHCHRLGVKVFSDALGDHERVEDYRRAIRQGIDVIQTDCPVRVWRAIELEAASESTAGAPAK